eukprot:jgi/Tetstr1/432541/TSEL_021914.t1
MTLLFSGDTSAAAAAGGRWREALVEVLNGSLDRRDEYHALIEVNPDRREDLRKQLQWVHALWPDRMPERVARHAFDLGEAMGHDITHLTAELVLNYMGHVDAVTMEPPFSGLSPLGMQLGV